MSRRIAIAVHAAGAATVSLVSGWAGSGVVVCVVAPLLLLRFVWLDRESTMLGAAVFTALVAVMGMSERGTTGAVTVALGGFAAMEIAARGARIRRAQPLPGLRGDLLPTLGVMLAATTATSVAAALTVWRPPPYLAVAALALLVTGLFVVVVGRPERADERGPNPVEER